MGRGFHSVWIIGSGVIALITIIGLSLLSGMALTTTGYKTAPPWVDFIGMAAGLVFYWSALCWAIALLRSKPLVSIGLVAVALTLAYGYPAYDAQSYAKQRAQAADFAVVGPKPAFAGKTAVLLWGVFEDCAYNCWNLSQHMEARVLLVKMQDLQAADFDGPVDLLALPLFELDETKLRRVVDLPESIDFALINETGAAGFDNAFERFRPRGIARTGLHIDALIVATRDGRFVNLAQDEPLLRLMNVSRNLASNPWLPGAGRKLYWNSSDRRANSEVALNYFSTSYAGDDRHWCKNAFD